MSDQGSEGNGEGAQHTMLTVCDGKMCWNGAPFNELSVGELQAMIHHAITSPAAAKHLFGVDGYYAKMGARQR